MSDVGPEIIVKTQKTLGKYVKKPVLTEKLLKKPPFRFLHDVIKAVVKETGFLEGLFTEAELDSDNVKEKEAKVAFLTKLIDAVKTVSKTELKVRPSKIVAGLEPKETNILLQTIAKSIDKKIDTKNYVAQLHSAAPKDKAITKKTSSRKPHREASVTRSNLKVGKSDSTPKSSDRSSSKKTKEKISDKKKTVKDEPTKNIPDSEVKNVVEEVTEEGSTSQNVTNEDAKEETVVDNEPPLKEIEAPDMSSFSNARQSSAGLVRPKSARPKSGDREAPLRTSSTSVSSTVVAPSASLRPPSVRPSSARPGAPRLRPDSAMLPSEPVAMGNIKLIVENFDSGLGDDEDTVVIQNAPEVVDETLPDFAGEKGQLVEQILEQINEVQEEGVVGRRVEIDWEQDGLRGKDATTREVTQLRALIQSLTKTANPLGKLMNYLHEDLEAMHNELQMWTNTKRQLYIEIDKQKKLAAESSKPLLDKLSHLRHDISKQEQEILTVRGNILRNEQRIVELLGNAK